MTRSSILAGFLAGWAVLVEFTAFFGVIALLVYALARDRRAPLLMVVGALPPAMLLLGYNWLSFGDPFSLGYSNLADEGFAEGMSRGIFGITLPRAEALDEIMLEPRGMLRLSPWLSLAPLGIWTMRRPGLRNDVILCAAIVLAFLLFNAGYYLPLGGRTPGPRFLVPALPFATVLVALAPGVFRPLIGLQMAYSIIVLTMATATIPNVAEPVVDPLGDLWLPRIASGELAETNAWLNWGMQGRQPLLLLGLAAAVALIALIVTTRATPGARWLGRGLIGLLSLLVIVFATPVSATTAFGRAPNDTATGAGDPAGIGVVATGVTREPMGHGRTHIALWAQLENQGGPIDKTTVIFSIYAPSGEQIWAASHGDVQWHSRERKHLRVEWDAEAEPGDYYFSVAVTSPDEEVIYASVESPDRIVISD